MKHVYTTKKFFLFILPALIFYVALMLAPLVEAVFLSFTKYQGFGTPEWVGLDNFKALLKDKYVWLSIKNTFIMMLVYTGLSLPISFLLAVFLEKASAKNTVYKTIFFIPYIIPGIIAGLIWLFILDPTMGLINTLLSALHLDNLKQAWIGGLKLTPYSIGFVQTWMSMGFNIAIWITGLKAIPREIMESSEIDGAGKFQKLIYITLPLTSETGKIILVLSVLNGFKVFDLVYQLTGGGPNHASESIVSYMYSQTFAVRRFGYGMAIAVFQFIICLILTLVCLKISKKKFED